MEKNSISLLTRKGRLETCLNGKTPYFPCFYISKKKKNRIHCFKDNSVPNRILPRKQPGLYMIFCLQNDWRYYGESSNVSGRLSSHKSLLNRKIHPNRSLQFDWDFYGSSMFEFVILYMGTDWEEKWIRRGKETELIVLDRNKSYNILEDESRPGELNPFWKRCHTPETKTKISQALKNRPNDLLGRKVSIRGIEYPSISEASRQTNISRKTIRKKIEDKNDPFFFET
jgi:GIY-YIG catalytic domain/NUMOD1 domain/NUMOD3 motif